MISLTARQHDLLSFIASCEICPTFDEMRAAIGCESASTVTRALNGLVERGYIRRLRQRARAIEVLQLPRSLRPMRLRFVLPGIPPFPRPTAGEGPTPFWGYPDRSARTCADWLEAA